MEPRPILLVEDNADDVTLTQRAVAMAGIQNRLVVASTILQAKQALGKSAEDSLPALLVLDLHLPDGSGLDFLEWVRSQPSAVRDLPAIVVTGSHQRTDEMRADRLGAILFLRKPVDKTLLSAAIVHLGLRVSSDQSGSLIVAPSA